MGTNEVSREFPDHGSEFDEMKLRIADDDLETPFPLLCFNHCVSRLLQAADKTGPDDSEPRYGPLLCHETEQ
jgi:hypothetical protein